MERSKTHKAMMVVTTYETWSFLLQGISKRPRHRYTKIEAYYDLLNRQRIMILDGGGDDCIDACLQDLANVWRWDRGTVQRFIERLEQYGALTTSVDYSRNKRIMIRVNNISGLTPIKEDRPSVKTIDSESASDSTISGRTPTTQGGHGARQDDS